MWLTRQQRDLQPEGDRKKKTEMCYYGELLYYYQAVNVKLSYRVI